MKRLLILDSNSILNRAYYGIRYLSAKDGTPTHALFGFFNILLKLIDEEKPDCIAAAFDVHAPTFRHMKYDAYKAQRKPMPDDLAVQMPLAKKILAGMGIPVLELEGYEADDIIGTVSRICAEHGVECLIATGDKDDLQLASDLTKVILTVTRKGVNETTIYDAAAVKEHFGVTPEEYIDVKALMGDPSDNIPGVAGIGEKTAFSLISQFHSIDYIYEHIDEIGVKGARLQKLKDGKESAYMSKDLATIDRNAPIEFSIDGCAYVGITDPDGSLYNTLFSLDLHMLIKRMGLQPKNDAPAPIQEDIFEGVRFVHLNENDDKSEFTAALSEAEEFAFTIEYTGNFAVVIHAAAGNTAYTVCDSDPVGLIRPFTEDSSKYKITFDIKEAMVKSGIRLQDKWEDLAIAAYLIRPSVGGTPIDKLAAQYFGAVISDSADKQLDLFDDTAADAAGDIGAKRAYVLLKLRKPLLAALEKNGQTALYRDIELPLIEVLADMQIDGILIDSEQLESFTVMISARIDELEERIYELAGCKFNLNSPKQLGEVLFDKLGLKAGKKNHRGYSTDADTLEKLRSEHPIVPAMLEYRSLAKLKSTYCDGLKAVINPETKRIHSLFNQMATITGRISSAEPNMQNIPVRTELGRELRKMFIAKDGCVLVDADYSQIELRVLAHIADDKDMIEAFRTGEDIHAVTASQVFGVPVSEVTPSMRRNAKAVNFGIVYGIGEYSLSQDIGTTVRQAKQYIESYLERYSGVREYMQEIKKEAKAQGYVKTLYNRVRYIPELKSPNHNVRAFGERAALNTPIQGTAADIIKLAMVKVHKRLADEGLKSRLILQIHDELLIEAAEDEAEYVKKILKEEMENAMHLSVPLDVDMSTGKSWYDAK